MTRREAGILIHISKSDTVCIAEGTPEEVANLAHSYTGQFLKNMLARNRTRSAA